MEENIKFHRELSETGGFVLVPQRYGYEAYIIEPGHGGHRRLGAFRTANIAFQAYLEAAS